MEKTGKSPKIVTLIVHFNNDIDDVTDSGFLHGEANFARV